MIPSKFEEGFKSERLEVRLLMTGKWCVEVWGLGRAMREPGCFSSFFLSPFSLSSLILPNIRLKLTVIFFAFIHLVLGLVVLHLDVPWILKDILLPISKIKTYQKSFYLCQRKKSLGSNFHVVIILNLKFIRVLVY